MDEFRNEKMKEVVISYASAGMDKYQQNYGTTQLELLAMQWGCKHFHHYLLGRPFKLETNHISIKWLLNKSDIARHLA